MTPEDWENMRGRLEDALGEDARQEATTHLTLLSELAMEFHEMLSARDRAKRNPLNLASEATTYCAILREIRGLLASGGQS